MEKLLAEIYRMGEVRHPLRGKASPGTQRNTFRCGGRWRSAGATDEGVEAFSLEAAVSPQLTDERNWIISIWDISVAKPYGHREISSVRDYRFI